MALMKTIWKGIHSHNKNYVWFPTDRDRVFYIKKMIKHFSEKVDIK